MSTNMGDEENIPPDAEACCETVARQEEIYLETTEEELRATLTCEATTAEHLRMSREKLELDWDLEIFDVGCKCNSSERQSVRQADGTNPHSEEREQK